MYRNTNHTPCGGAPEAAIIALERRAPERWNQGDPDGFLELTSGDVVYFDPALGRKLIGKSPRRVLRHGQGQSQDRHVPDDRPRRAVVAGRCRPGIRLRGPQGRAGVQDALHGSLHGRNVRRLGDRTYALVFRPAGRLRRCGVPDIRRAGVWNANCTARGMEKESVNGSHNAGTWIGPYCTCACSREA